MTRRAEVAAAIGITAVVSVAMSCLVLGLELRYGTSRAWLDGVQLPEALAVFVRTAGVLIAFPVVVVVLAIIAREVSSVHKTRHLSHIYLITLGISCAVFSLFLVLWY